MRVGDAPAPMMPPQKQRDKSLETMEVYAPLAHRLGLKLVKEELEDRALKFLDPVAYNEIENQLELRKDERQKFMVCRRCEEGSESQRLPHAADVYHSRFSFLIQCFCCRGFRLCGSKRLGFPFAP